MMGTVKDVKKNGGSKSDTLLGGLGNDTIKGNGGDDFITGGVGNDIIDGGTGKDVAVFSGSLADYVMVTSGKTTTVTAKSGTDGIDSLTNIEFFQFKDGKFSLADLNEKPVVGLNDLLSNGMPLSRYNFVGTDEADDVLTAFNNSSNSVGGFVNAFSGNDIVRGFNWGEPSNTSKPFNSDTLCGGSGNDTVDGARGSDVIIGGTGIDNLTGGLETSYALSNGGVVPDTFVFGVGDTGVGVNNRDVITDFGKVDVIDLSGKTVQGSVGFGHLTFVASANFSAVNQVRYAVDSINKLTIVQINLNSDTTAPEAEIELVGAALMLSANNFLLA
jgi:Ca2+-binding RTX toxin-like protein